MVGACDVFFTLVVHSFSPPAGGDSLSLSCQRKSAKKGAPEMATPSLNLCNRAEAGKTRFAQTVPGLFSARLHKFKAPSRAGTATPSVNCPGALCFLPLSEVRSPMLVFRTPLSKPKDPIPQLKSPMPEQKLPSSGRQHSSVGRRGRTSEPIAPTPEQKGPTGRSSEPRARSTKLRLRSTKHDVRSDLLHRRLSKLADAELKVPTAKISPPNTRQIRRTPAISASNTRLQARPAPPKP